MIIRRPDAEDVYSDVDLQLGPQSKLYLVSFNQKLFLTVGGLAYVDLVHQLPSSKLFDQRLLLQIDRQYTNTQP